MKPGSAAPRLPDFIEPMQAKLVDSMPPGDWLFEVKLDGYRAVGMRGGSETRIVSRNKKDLGAKFPEVRDSVAALDVQDAIVDGEIVALDEKGRSSFQMLQAHDMGEERPQIIYYAFDLLRLNGKDLQALPIERRKAQLEELLKKPPGVIRYSVSFTKDIKELLARAQELGLEGLIGKRSGSRYEPGKRTGAWVKIKLHQEQEFVIGGYTEPEGSRKYFGALLVGFFEAKNFKFAGRVGTGFSDKLLSTLYSELSKIRIEECPFYNLPAAGRSRWDQMLILTCAFLAHFLDSECCPPHGCVHSDRELPMRNALLARRAGSRSGSPIWMEAIAKPSSQVVVQ